MWSRTPNSLLVWLIYPFPVAIHSQSDATQGTGGEADDSTASPARHHTSRSSTTTRSQKEEEVPGTQDVSSSSRQRPLSAPPKAYPFSRDLELSREHDLPGKVGYRDATVRVGKYDNGCLAPREAGRLQGGGESKERAVRGYGEQALGASGETRTAQQRLSLSSIFAAASERRVSEEKRPSIRSSLLLDGHERHASRGAAQPDLREEREKEGCRKAKSTPVALSSQEFGLHRWKEYAVLRWGGSFNCTYIVYVPSNNPSSFAAGQLTHGSLPALRAFSSTTRETTQLHPEPRF